ncbi:MAG: radical SAM protein [Candidatus Methanoperedens sp.]|nr:radical SAM protein [Candidatus Methanoperedens sp.]
MFLIYPTYSSWFIELFQKKEARDLEFNKPRIPPFGILYIASYLRSNGYTVDVIDISATKIKKSDFIKMLEDRNPKIVGLSVVSENYISALQFCEAIKEWNSDTITVLGGPHVTFMDKEACSNKYVDIVVRNEGEITFLELVNYFIGNRSNGKLNHLNNIKGITFTSDNSEIVRTGKRPFIENLDILPFPARDLINLEDYFVRGGIIASRGCPGACIFCAASALAGGRYRMRSVDNILEEIEHIIKIYGFDFIYFMDDTFTVVPKRTEEFCRKKNERGLEFKWYCESRVDVGNYQLFKTMADGGCYQIQFGVESGSQEVLDAIRKKITLEQVENSVKWAHEAGIPEIICSFMLGHHAETHESIRKSMNFAEHLYQKYGVYPIFSMNTPYPGTYIYKNREKLGITIHTKDWNSNLMTSSNISTKYLDRDDIQRYYLHIHENFGKKYIEFQKKKIYKRFGQKPGGNLHE